MRPRRLVAEAADEFTQQTRYYRRLDPDVAVRFVTVVESTLDFLRENPFAAPSLRGGYRARVLGRPFRYRVIYKLRDDVLVVAAIWADRRDPAELADRIANIEARGE